MCTLISTSLQMSSALQVSAQSLGSLMGCISHVMPVRKSVIILLVETFVADGIVHVAGYSLLRDTDYCSRGTVYTHMARTLQKPLNGLRCCLWCRLQVQETLYSVGVLISPQTQCSLCQIILAGRTAQPPRPHLITDDGLE